VSGASLALSDATLAKAAEIGGVDKLRPLPG
jgi:hypothetical protein